MLRFTLSGNNGLTARPIFSNEPNSIRFGIILRSAIRRIALVYSVELLLP